MHILHKFFLNPQRIACAGTFLLVISLTYSRAGMSIGMGMVVWAALVHAIQQKGNLVLRTPLLVSLLAAIFGLFLLSVCYTVDLSRWSNDLRVKLPLLILPLAFAILPSLSSKQYGLLVRLMVAANSLLAAACIGMHLFRLGGWSAYSASDGYIPMLTDINHIYFSVILGFSVLMGGYYYFQHRKRLSGNQRILLLAACLLGYICLHIIKSRTGVLGFYGGLIGMSLFALNGISSRKRLMGIAGAGLVVCLLFLTIPFLQQRVQQTYQDTFHPTQPQSEWDYTSVSLRFRAWEGAWSLFQQEPLWGIGISDVESQLIWQYQQEQFPARRSLWLDSAHNQYLEYLMGLGMIGFTLFLLLLFYPLYAFRAWDPVPFTGFICLVAVAMLTESFLERQIGIGFFVTGFMLLAAQGTERTFSVRFFRFKWFRPVKRRLLAAGRSFPFF